MPDPIYCDSELSPRGSGLGISHYTALLLRYRWLAIIPFCLSMLVGIYLALTLPKQYESKTMILVESQKVPSDYVKSLVSSDINSRISTISQQIMSRTNLQKIIEEFDLFSGPKFRGLFLEDKLKILADRITVEVNSNRKRGKRHRGQEPINTFSIYFRGSDPKKTQQITNTLASYFINQNLKIIESDAVGTKTFLTDELERMRKRLEAVEDKLKDYRSRYMGELPEQLDSNLSMLDRLQQQLSQKQELLRDDKNRLAVLENQIQIARQKQNRLAEESPDAAGEPNTLEGLKRLLAAYQTRYTSRHPDIVRLEKKIRYLESLQPGDAKHPLAGKSKTGAAEKDTHPGSEEMAQLMLEREALKREIETKHQELKRLLSQIKFYQQRVENTPKREQELLTLRRDYEDIKAMYNSMQERKLEADIAVNMARKQKGEQFRVIDPANRPQKPISPNMRKLFLFCIAFGVGSGAGIIFLIDFFDRSLSRPEEAESVLGIPVLAAIPKVAHTRDRVLRRLNQGASIAGLLLAAGLLAGLASVSILNYEPVIRMLSRYARLS